MSKHGKRDLLIHFDETTNQIVLFTVSEANTANIRAAEFDGVRIDISELQRVEPQDAEQTVGEIVLSLIDTFSNKRTGIRDYESLIKARRQKDVSDYETAAAEGDPEAQCMLFIEYHHRALSQADQQALEMAEQMLKFAAGAGYEEAKVRLESDWQLTGR